MLCLIMIVLRLLCSLPNHNSRQATLPGLQRCGSSIPTLSTRQLVEDALRQYRQHVRTCLVFTEDLGSSAASPPPQVLLVNVTGAGSVESGSSAQHQTAMARCPGDFPSQFHDIHLWAEAIRVGAYDFLSKPIDPDQLRVGSDRRVSDRAGTRLQTSGSFNESLGLRHKLWTAEQQGRNYQIKRRRP